MKARLNFKATNTYKVELIDSRTGNVHQKGSFHNIITDGAKRMIAYTTGTNETFERTFLSDIFYNLRCGSGTATPVMTDTDLTSPMWDFFSPEVRSDITWPEPHTLRASATYTIPANASYVGTVTEIGLFARGAVNWPGSSIRPGRDAMCAHALLTDSEGQVISFAKTDLDILKITVTVELTMNSNSADFTVFNHPYPLVKFVEKDASWGGIKWPYGAFEVRRFGADITDNTPIASYGAPVVIDQAFGDQSSLRGTNTSERLGVDWPKSRLTSDIVTSETYYQGLAITGLGGWKLPNENIFPAYSIKNIPIGTGDGSTKAFTSPLSYFKKDTDKVYKNGTLLTRGVDYTLYHCNNAKHLPEISNIHGVLPKTVSYAGEPGKFYPNPGYPFLVGNRQPGNAAQQATLGRVYSFNSSAPILFNYYEPVTLNYLNGNNVKTFNTGNSAGASVATYTLYYSDDGEQYTEAASATGSTFDVSFADITAKYWKLTTTTGSNYKGWYGDFLESNSFLTVGYSDPYITFTEAPAEGDELTMEVEMDIIMKNSNFVVDAEASIDFVIGG